MKISFDTDIARAMAQVKKLEKNIQKETHRKARAYIRRRVRDLKSNLNFLINQYQRVPGTNDQLTAQPLAQKIAEDQAFGKTIPVKYGDDFHTTFESPIIKAARVNGGNNLVARVRDSSIHPDATYEEYRDSFINTLTDKVFAIQDATTGSYRYFIIPPDSSLLDDVLAGVKIFCSSFTDIAGMGRDDGDPLQDIGLKAGIEKFRRDKAKGHTEFTLKESALLEIEKRGIEVTEIVTNVQHGEYLDNKTIASSMNSPAMQKVQQRATLAIEEKEISPEAEALAKANNIIKSVDVKERETKDSIEYIIKASIDTQPLYSTNQPQQTAIAKAFAEATAKEVEHALIREATVWSSELVGPLKTEIQKALEKALADFNKKGA